MIDLVVTIKTHTESSTSELSLGTFGHFKVHWEMNLAVQGEFEKGW